jgi:N-acylneuraminate cytidylyltransferase
MYDHLGKEFDALCCSIPTCAFINPERLRIGMQMLFDNEVDSIIPVVRFSFPTATRVYNKR